jgi:hypothetical protein
MLSKCHPCPDTVPGGVCSLFQINNLQIRWNKFLFWCVLHYPNDSGTPLQRIPYFQQTPVAILLPLVIPKSKDLDVFPRQSFRTRFIFFDFFRRAVLKAVEFDGELCLSTIKIQNRIPNVVLPTKFETGKLPSPQRFPKLLFFFRLVSAKIARDLF